MPNTITTFYTFSPGTPARSNEVNINFSNYRGDLVPINTNTQTSSDNTHLLGTSEHRWKDVHIGEKIYLGSVSSNYMTHTDGAFYFYYNSSFTATLRSYYGYFDELGINSAPTSTADLFFGSTDTVLQVKGTNASFNIDLPQGGDTSTNQFNFKIAGTTKFGYKGGNTTTFAFFINCSAGAVPASVSYFVDHRHSPTPVSRIYGQTGGVLDFGLTSHNTVGNNTLQLLCYGTTAGGARIQYNSDGIIGFNDAISRGLVGIGGTRANSVFSVNHAVTSASESMVLLYNASSTVTAAYTFIDFDHANANTVNTVYYCKFQQASGIIGSIQGSGTSGVNFNNTSDARLKTSIEPLDSCLEKIVKADPVKFYWKNVKFKQEEKSIGFIAQDLMKVIPCAVTGKEEEFKLNPDGSYENPLQVKLLKLIPFMVGAIKELNEKIKKLEEKNA